MTLTHDQVEEAKKKLTMEAFSARQLSAVRGEFPLLWLCTKSEVQQEHLARLKTAYEAWVEEEINMLSERLSGDLTSGSSRR